MPTFLALQCYKCNMMQVKHDKKSSNKWSCSVCNEKQSVRKVFATSTAAKDIRKFVQDYNLSHDIARDHALAETVQEVDGGGDSGFMCDAAPSCTIFGDEFSHPHVNTESKWTEYLPFENEGLCAETSEDALEDAKFVTTIPEKFGRKPKGRVRAAVEEQDEQFPLQQKQSLSLTRSLTRRRNVTFLNRPIKRVTECHDDVQKENDLPSLWAGKASLGSLLQVQKNASMHHRQQLFGYKVAQKTVADLLPQRSEGIDLNGERVLMQGNFESKANVASKMPEISRGVKEKLSKWATFLDLEEDVRAERTCTEAEEEKHVSKWAKYMESDEVKPRVEAMQDSDPAAKWGKFQDASQEASLKPGQARESSSMWSLKAASNLQCLNSLVKTELDEFLNMPCISQEVDEEVYPLLL